MNCVRDCDRRVVVAAVSLSRSSTTTLRAALGLAEWLGGYLDVVHVAPRSASSAELRDRRRRLEELARAEAGRREAELEFTTHLDRGRWLERFARHSDSVGADVVVVGGRRDSGSGSEKAAWSRMLRRAARPLLIAHRETALPPSRILAAVDDSRLSGQSLHSAVRLLSARRQLSGGAPEWRLLTVVEELDADPSVARRSSETGLEVLERIERRYGPVPDGTAKKVARGLAAPRILDEIWWSNSDLLILGTHGRSGLDRLFHGSVATELATRAPCNVLVIPPEAAYASTDDLADRADEDVDGRHDAGFASSGG